MENSAYLQGTIATALVEREAWSVMWDKRQVEGLPEMHRCTIFIPGRGSFNGDQPAIPDIPGFEERSDRWYEDRDMAYRAAVAQVAESYYRDMLNQITTDQRRLAEDRMPDRRMMG